MLSFIKAPEVKNEELKKFIIEKKTNMINYLKNNVDLEKNEEFISVCDQLESTDVEKFIHVLRTFMIPIKDHPKIIEETAMTVFGINKSKVDEEIQKRLFDYFKMFCDVLE